MTSEKVMDLVEQPLTQDDVRRRYPRLVAHMVCDSLGYFTPGAAAQALKAYKENVPNCCEWYVHMARGFNDDKLLDVGKHVVQRAFESRHHHRGYMAHYPMARKLVEEELAGRGPVFASWF